MTKSSLRLVFSLPCTVRRIASWRRTILFAGTGAQAAPDFQKMKNIHSNNRFAVGVYFLRHWLRMNTQPNRTRLNYRTSMSIAQELRTVGQGLESLEADDFDLRGEEDGYFVLAISPRSAAGSGAIAGKEKLHGLWRSLIGRRTTDRRLSESGPDVLRVLFTPEGILRLEAAGMARRATQSSGSPDFTKLAQLLRMVGEHLDANAGRLRRLRKRGRWISFEYATATEECVEEWKLSELREIWLEARQRRSDPL